MTEPPFPMRTDRVTLRFLQDRDVETVTAYRNDPAVSALQDWELPYPIERARQLVADHVGRLDVEPGRGTQLGIEHEGRLVGDLYAGLDEHGGILDIGYTLIPSAQGKGLASEAAAAVVDDLIERCGVHRIRAELSADNHASARLLERIGMTFESFSRLSFWWRGAWDDNLVYAMSADERRAWRERATGAPEWVRLVPLTARNRETYGRLRVHRSQESIVAGVSESYAEALFAGTEGSTVGTPVLRGITADGVPAGFLMYEEPLEGSSTPRVLNLLIDRAHQGRGIGRRAVELAMGSRASP